MYDEELIGRIRPGMDLCSNDFKKWGNVDSVEHPSGADSGEPVVAGHVQDGGRSVYVPASAVLQIRSDKCVVFDAPLVEADVQGWEQKPDFLSTKSV